MGEEVETGQGDQQGGRILQVARRIQVRTQHLVAERLLGSRIRGTHVGRPIGVQGHLAEAVGATDQRRVVFADDVEREDVARQRPCLGGVRVLEPFEIAIRGVGQGDREPVEAAASPGPDARVQFPGLGMQDTVRDDHRRVARPDEGLARQLVHVA
ncbi:hypothetical protein, partial [Propioniciclava sp.]|uniref:hypothetical protein n=1 Tax=Propioniciclava sp. TaxID=2038686 RepID=UPI00260BC814